MLDVIQVFCLYLCPFLAYVYACSFCSIKKLGVEAETDERRIFNGKGVVPKHASFSSP